MSAACFKSDRIIYLDSFSIDIDFPPASILQYSSGFDTLVLSNIPRIEANSEPFWRRLGESVTELRISHSGGSSEDHSVIYESLINVKVLHFHNIVESHEFFETRKERFSKFLKSIEEIHFGFSPRYLKRVHKILSLMPNLKKIYSQIFSLGHHAEEWVNLIDYFLEYQEKMKWLPINLNNWKSLTSQKHLYDERDIHNILMQTLTKSKLEGIDYHTKDDFDLLLALTETQSTLKSLRIKASILPPVSITKITHLDLSFDKPIVNFKSLEQLKNLEHLSLHWQWTGQDELDPFCYFGHTALKLNTVKQLSVNIKTNVLCEKCLKANLQSMPDLKSLYITVYEIEMFELEIVVLYLKGLEQLHLSGINTTQGFLDFIWQLDENESYDSLTELVLCGLSTVSFCMNSCFKENNN